MTILNSHHRSAFKPADPERSRRVVADPNGSETVTAVTQTPGRSLWRNEESDLRERLGDGNSPTGVLTDVRVHSGPVAAKSAASVGAVSYAVGRHVVLGSQAQTLPPSGRGSLLAHEVTHALQQRPVWHKPIVRPAVGPIDDHHERAAHRVGGTGSRAGSRGGRRSGQKAGHGAGGGPRTLTEPRVQRLKFLLGLFAGEDFDESVLHRYLERLSSTNRTEGRGDSDNKARAVVRDWISGESEYTVTDRRAALMIREMQSGATLDGDENAILEILARSPNHHLSYIFGAGGVKVRRLIGDFQGDEEDRLLALLGRRFEGGSAALREGTVTPQGSPVPLGQDLNEEPEENEPESADLQAPVCSMMHPENCHTYESWIGLFHDLAVDEDGELDEETTFRGRSGHTVLGGGAAPQATSADINAQESERRPPLVHGRSPYREADAFIDGPTEEWVRQNLPPHLVEVAYQLPSDCADVAVILRHVWLVYHQRSETYRGWQCGSDLDDPESRQLQRDLVNTIWTGSVDRMLRPYVDENGNRLTSWAALESRLRVGDVLVWNHTDTASGHTHTIMGIDRDRRGRVQNLRFLQGNQPIGQRRAGQIEPGETLAAERRRRRLRAAPGRRIEISEFSRAEIQDRGGVWTWDDGTTVLVAAGPPVEREGVEANQVHGLGDWADVMAVVNDLDDLQSRFEAALLDTRSLAGAGRDVQLGDAARFGRATGGRLWALANEAARAQLAQATRLSGDDLGETSHYRPLQHMLGMARQMAAGIPDRALKQAFSTIVAELEPAARGIGDVSFDREAPADRRVLITGFDPFGYDTGHPDPGQFNPSAAAVLRLDGVTLTDEGVNIAVEGVILPVSYDQFRAGLVESLIDRHRDVLDAVVTISLDPNRGPDDPMQLERFAVGVHQLRDHTLEPVAGHPSPQDRGPAIVPARAPADIGQQAGLDEDALVEDRSIRFRFRSAALADRALEALGLPPQRVDDPTIGDPSALDTIVATMRRGVDGTRLTFAAQEQSFTAQIERGPGGSFLSNEVSFRVLRRLSAQPDSETKSFHLHVPRGVDAASGTIPQSVQTDEHRQSRLAVLTRARQVMGRQVEHIKALIRAIVRRPAPTSPDNDGSD